MTGDAINPPATIAELTLRIEQRFDKVTVVKEVSTNAPNGKAWITLTCGVSSDKNGGKKYAVGEDEAAACAMFLREFEISTFAGMNDELYWRIRPELHLLKNRGFAVVARCQAD